MIKNSILVITILLSLILGLINSNAANDDNECRRLLSDITEKIKVLKKALSASTATYHGVYDDVIRIIDNYIQNNHDNLSCRELVLIHEIIDTIILDILENNNIHNIHNTRATIATKIKTFTVNITTKNYVVLYNRIKSMNSSTTTNISLNESTTASAINYHDLAVSGNVSIITSIQLSRLNYTHIFPSNYGNSSHKTLTVGLGIQTVVTSIITIIMLAILLIIMFKPRL